MSAENSVVVSPKAKRILVVDDNIDSADMLGEVLREIGHEVAVANDPGVALALLEDFTPDVAILDIGLPMMDGYELAERILETPGASACRLIALTGYGQQYDRSRSARTGFANHLVKPVDLDALTQIIDTM
jgi:CheY-like chemotaxis protein